MNFVFYNEYQEKIESLIFGVPFTREQRAKAITAIWESVEKNCEPEGIINEIHFCLLHFVQPVNGVKNRLADAYIKIYDKEYRDPADFYNICQNIIMQTSQKRDHKEVTP